MQIFLMAVRPAGSISQRLEQRVSPILVELDVQLGGHFVRQIEPLPAARHWQQQGLRAFLNGFVVQPTISVCRERRRLPLSTDSALKTIGCV